MAASCICDPKIGPFVAYTRLSCRSTALQENAKTYPLQKYGAYSVTLIFQFNFDHNLFFGTHKNYILFIIAGMSFSGSVCFVRFTWSSYLLYFSVLTTFSAFAANYRHHFALSAGSHSYVFCTRLFCTVCCFCKQLLLHCFSLFVAFAYLEIYYEPFQWITW